MRERKGGREVGWEDDRGMKERERMTWHTHASPNICMYMYIVDFGISMNSEWSECRKKKWKLEDVDDDKEEEEVVEKTSGH